MDTKFSVTDTDDAFRVAARLVHDGWKIELTADAATGDAVIRTNAHPVSVDTVALVERVYGIEWPENARNY